MKKTMSALLAVTMLLCTAILTGCSSGESENTKTNSNISSQTSSNSAGTSQSSKSSTDFAYKQLDVKQFDKTKFNKNIKIGYYALNDDSEFNLHNDVTAPIKSEDIYTYDLTIGTNNVSLEKDADKAKNSSGVISLAPNEVGDYLLKRNANGEITPFMYRLSLYNPTDKKINLKDALDNNWVGLTNTIDSEIYITNIIDTPENDSRTFQKSDNSQYTLLLDTLGVPSTIIANFAQSKDVGTVEYVYEYDDVVLTFGMAQYSEKNNGTVEINSFTCELPKSYKLRQTARQNSDEADNYEIINNQK